MPAASSSFLFRRLHRLGSLPALARLLLAAALGGVAYLLTPAALHPLTRVVAGWDAFALASLGLLWAAIVTADANHIRTVARTEDPGRTASFVFILGASLASLLAVVALLDVMRAQHGPLLLRYAGLSVAGVMTAWLLVHTLFTLRYAHLYYDPELDGGEGGLQFPGAQPEPDYLDFAYFAFVIGMTAQTADIGIDGRVLRRMALLHGLISFGFNTAVVALTVGAIAGVL
ncbi:DUF1345 domain-containing protein [Hymenobacter jeollabukensis]|uniref:DUF1345 domain-containing protein n=1 Tax=Hymenobacter jeollabukensis TaxID=2025313 RepID=A0A5R8WSJ5_9BACT|nr:DUF1345 domain-containing protein [Hymenobacter jeollabukensis]TLM94161.1 DUF1345 domain-containing protein [Hymenobacter jeollabukensis]